MVLLVLVVYTYYLAPVIDNDSYRFVFSIGFFLAIALSLIPLLRNVFGAHYMFLSNMLHLSDSVRLNGHAHGSISDAPLGYVVLEAEQKTKTFVPAGGTATCLTAVFNDSFRPFDLEFRLDPRASVRQIRAFIQDLDHVLSGFDIKGASMLSSSVDQSRSLQAPAFEQGSVEFEALLRARGRAIKLSLQPNTRWVVNVSCFFSAAQKVDWLQAQTKVIELIHSVIEQHRLQHVS
ncbi:hypothetical protein PINS_up007211 [Pythium insidiosum]|nr:hypothetical protein PINS_up007211 [Pythium insidiosum]